MQAVTISDGELLLAEHPDPEPGAGEVLVAVLADMERRDQRAIGPSDQHRSFEREFPDHGLHVVRPLPGVLVTLLAGRLPGLAVAAQIGRDEAELAREFALGEQNGLQVIFERGLDGGNEGRIGHFDAAGEQTAHAGGIDLGIVEAAEHLLRAGGEAFAFLQQLLDDFEA